MLQTAAFVDAGYVYAQGSVLLTNQKQPRASIRLDVEKTLKSVSKVAHEAGNGARLLRIYWYDGTPRGGRLSLEQAEIAKSENVKLRLGLVNSKGEQKGVDSLIVTDLIDLARNQAISDALIVSGDEDIRVGVQVAQTFGVRVHLLGIKPALGSQSPDLIQEADTHREWDREVVGDWLTINSKSAPAIEQLPKGAIPELAERKSGQPFDTVLEIEISAQIGRLGREELERIHKNACETGMVPPELDRPMLARIRNSLGRDLSPQERKTYRNSLIARLRAGK